jgi:TIR domain
MTRIFLSYAQENTACAETLRSGLEAQGYTVWRAPTYPDPNSASYPHMIETAVLGSAALVLVWSQDAIQNAWVERNALFAQQLKKPIFPIVLDGTSLPDTLISASPPLIQTDCADAVKALVALSSFPPAHSTDALITLSELAAHEYIRERKTAIDQAADLLARSEHTDEVLALLTYLAKNDTIMGVREEAQKVLDAHTPQLTPSQPAFQPQDAQYIFGVRCKNGHVSYFDKRVVCTAHTSFPRVFQASAGKELDELYLTCQTCGVEVVAYEDCGEYK